MKAFVTFWWRPTVVVAAHIALGFFAYLSISACPAHPAYLRF